MARRRRAALAQAEALPRLRAGRNPEARRTVERRHLDLRPERRFVNRDRHDDVEVVAVAPEHRMRLHQQRHVQIARLAAVLPGVALAGDPDPRAVGQPGRHVQREQLGSRLELVAAT